MEGDPMSKQENEFICPSCGEINDGDLDFCEFCGEDLRPEELKKKEPEKAGGGRSVIGWIVIAICILIYLIAKK